MNEKIILNKNGQKLRRGCYICQKCHAPPPGLYFLKGFYYCNRCSPLRNHGTMIERMVCNGLWRIENEKSLT